MRSSLRQFLRIWHIGVILKRYRLDNLFNTAQLPAPIRWLRVFIPAGKDFSGSPRGERLRMALQDLGPVYSGARLFVYPSLIEGFGLPPLEAMAMGRTVIATPVGGVPEVITDVLVNEETGILSMTDTDRFHENVLEFCIARIGHSSLTHCKCLIPN